MKKSLLVFSTVLLLCSVASAQVIEGFNTPGSLGMYAYNHWGTPGLIDSIYQTTSPTGGGGALAVALNLRGAWDKDAIGLKGNLKGTINSNSAHQLTFWAYIPAGSTIPDSVSLGVYFQSPTNWGKWNEVDTYAGSLPKGKWFPLSFALKDSAIKDPTNYGNGTRDIGDFGIQFSTGGNSSTQIWKGVVYIDSVSLIGVNPTTVADFSSNLNNLNIGWTNGWADSLYQIHGPVGDSTGIMVFELKAGTSPATGTAFAGNVADGGNVNAAGQNFLVCWVWADSTLPDSTQLIVYAQDRSNWKDPAPLYPPTYLGRDIPKRVWYPIYFDIMQAGILDTASFTPATNHFGWYGLMLGGKPGTVYVDKIQMINTFVPAPPSARSWIAADFSKTSQGFYVPASAAGTVQRYLDLTTSRPGYVLQGSLNISPTTPKFAVVRDSVPLMDADSIATNITFDLYMPSTTPRKGIVKFYVRTSAADSVAIIDTIGSQVKSIIWNTMVIPKLDSLAQVGKIDPTKRARIGVEVYYPAPYDTTSFAGNIELDNLKIYGINQSGLLGIENDAAVVKVFKLYGNYPNPFNPTTVIKYDVANETRVQIRIYDVLGRVVRTLVDRRQPMGSYVVQFDASQLSSGVYFYRMDAGSYVNTQKMMLLK